VPNYQLGNVKGQDLLRRFSQYSKAQVYVHAKKPLNGKRRPTNGTIIKADQAKYQNKMHAV